MFSDTFTTKRTINHRTKQIETRIQRQIIIEDGEVISDTGPLVTTKTLEDNKQEIDEIQENYSYDYTNSTNVNSNMKDHKNDKNDKKEKNSSNSMQTYVNPIHLFNLIQNLLK